jgi:hypothetical protein
MKVRVDIENKYIQVVRTQHNMKYILNVVYLGRISPAGHVKNVSHWLFNSALSSVEGTQRRIQNYEEYDLVVCNGV